MTDLNYIDVDWFDSVIEFIDRGVYARSDLQECNMKYILKDSYVFMSTAELTFPLLF